MRHALAHLALAAILPFSLGACMGVGDVSGPGNGDPGGAPDAGEPDPDPDPGTPRVTVGLQGLYLFDEGTGTVVTDQSNAGAALDLVVEDPLAVSWLPDGGIDVVSPTVIASPGPASKIGLACQASNAVTLEVWAKPVAVNQTGPARVLTMSGGNNTRNFTLGQNNELADVRLRTTDTDDNGEPATLSDLAAFDGQVRHIAYTWNGLDDEAQIWVDGQLNGTETLAGNFETWDMSYQLAVANEIGGERPWRGEIYLAAVYCRDLSPSEIFQNFTAGY